MTLQWSYFHVDRMDPFHDIFSLGTISVPFIFLSVPLDIVIDCEAER